MPKTTKEQTAAILIQFLGPEVKDGLLMLKLLDDLDAMSAKLINDKVPGYTYEERRISMKAAEDQKQEYYAQIGEKVVAAYRASSRNLRG